MKLAEILSGPETWHSPHTTRRPGTALRMCLTTAIAALTGEKYPKREFDRLSRIVGVASYPQVWTWNDAPGRTWEEVASVVEAYDRDRLLNP